MHTSFCLSLHFHADLDHHEEGASLFYICFSSFIAVGLFIMTVAVIVTTIRSKAKGVCLPTVYLFIAGMNIMNILMTTVR